MNLLHARSLGLVVTAVLASATTAAAAEMDAKVTPVKAGSPEAVADNTLTNRFKLELRVKPEAGNSMVRDVHICVAVSAPKKLGDDGRWIRGTVAGDNAPADWKELSGLLPAYQLPDVTWKYAGINEVGPDSRGVSYWYMSWTGGTALPEQTDQLFAAVYMDNVVAVDKNPCPRPFILTSSGSPDPSVGEIQGKSKDVPFLHAGKK